MIPNILFRKVDTGNIVLNHASEKLGEYWNSGWIQDFALIDKPISSIPIVDIINNQIISCLTAYAKISYDFNFQMEILKVRLSYTFEQLHKMAYMENRIIESLGTESCQNNLAAGILYYDGSRWVSKLVRAN